LQQAANSGSFPLKDSKFPLAQQPPTKDYTGNCTAELTARKQQDSPEILRLTGENVYQKVPLLLLSSL
jgi:hypothetical protein